MRIFGVLCLVAGFVFIVHFSDKYARAPTLDAGRLQVRASNLDFGIAVMIIGGIFAAAGFAVASLKKAGVQEAKRLPARKPCPMCAEAILPAARVCPFCRHDFSKS